MQPEYKNAKDELGLDNDAIQRLKSFLLPLGDIDDSGNPTGESMGVSMAKETNAIIKSQYFAEMVGIIFDAIRVTDNEEIAINTINHEPTKTTSDVSPYLFESFSISLREIYSSQFGKIAQNLYSEIVESIGKKDLKIMMDMTGEEKDAILDTIIEQEERFRRV